MACFRPLSGYRGPGGRLHGVPVAGYSFSGTSSKITISCGQCSGCRLERSRQWAIRCVHEAQTHEHNSFLTLTYDNEHLPEFGSLDLADWQLFAKRLRKQVGPFRYFHCGEYGDQTRRPHYHAAIFGLDFTSDRTLYSETRGHKLYTSKTLNDVWQNGQALIGSLTFQSAAYVARYIMKKINGPLADEHYEVVDTRTGLIGQLKPEYTTMSRRPGIGSEWFAKYHTDVFPSDEVIMNGKKFRPPTYYDTQYEQLDAENLKHIKRTRKATASKHAANNTPARLRVRETIQEAKTTQLKRTL